MRTHSISIGIAFVAITSCVWCIESIAQEEQQYEIIRNRGDLPCPSNALCLSGESGYNIWKAMQSGYTPNVSSLPPNQNTAGSMDPMTGKDPRQQGCSIGNPIVPSTGNKIETDVDFNSQYVFGFRVIRTYNKNSGFRGVFGDNWASDFDRRLIREQVNGSGIPARVRIYRPDASNLLFTLNANGTSWIDSTGKTASYVVLSAGEYIAYLQDGSIERYSSGGSLLRISDPQGVSWILTYTEPNRNVTAMLPNTSLTGVTHSGGRYLTFTWSLNGITSIRVGSGPFYQYGYSNYSLTSVTYPPTQTGVASSLIAGILTYHMGGNATLLGKSYAGVRYSTFAFDAQGRATSSEHAGGVDKYTFDYSVSGQTRVINPLNRSTTFVFDSDGNILTAVGAATTYCPSSTTLMQPGPAIGRRVYTDADGRKTETYADQYGNVYQATEAYETSYFVTRSFVWDVMPQRLRSSTSPFLRTSYTYAGNRLQSITSEDLSPYGTGRTQVTSVNTADADGNGIPETVVIDGPTPGTADQIVLQYNVAGDLISRAGPNGTITYSSHDVYGNPFAVRDAQGLTSYFGYDQRGRLSSAQTGQATANFAFNVRGDIAETRTPGGLVTKFTRDAALRLTKVSYPEPSRGCSSCTVRDFESWQGFRYDLMGSLIESKRSTSWKVFVPGAPTSGYPTSGAEYTQSFDNDEEGRLRAERDATGYLLTYTRYASGIVDTIHNASGLRVSKLTYDSSGRIASHTDARNGVTSIWSSDIFESTQLPHGAAVNVYRDGFGQATSLSDPNSGTTTIYRNNDGTPSSASYGDGKTHVYAYKTDGRVASVSASRAGQSLTRAFSYDNCPNGVGRICSLTESNGVTTSYGYNIYGRLASRTDTVLSVPLTTTWSYDTAAQLRTVSYPNGAATVQYVLVGSLLDAIDVTVNGTTRRVAASIRYLPFGPVQSFTDLTGSAVLLDSITVCFQRALRQRPRTGVCLSTLVD